MTANKNIHSAIIQIYSPDQPGLVAAVTDFINVNGGNIINLEQHVDKAENTFFMRIEWDLTNFIIHANQPLKLKD